MSDRLTTEWTPTAAGAFGATGVKGDEGEQFMCKVFETWGWECTAHPSSFGHQVGGVDITFRNPSWYNSYTADIKNNLNIYGAFYVETYDEGWLFNPKKVCDRIWHCNPQTGWMAWYDRNEMKRFIVSKGLRNTGLYKIGARDRVDFVTRRRYNVTKSDQ